MNNLSIFVFLFFVLLFLLYKAFFILSNNETIDNNIILEFDIYDGIIKITNIKKIIKELDIGKKPSAFWLKLYVVSIINLLSKCHQQAIKLTI